jgi:carbon starvation protein CstA
VGLTLLFAFSGGIMKLWDIFATSNQLLAAMVLSLGALWLLRQGRRVWYVLLPAAAMLVTTLASLVLFLKKNADGLIAALREHQVLPAGSIALTTAAVVLLGITVYLLVCGVREAVVGRGGRPGTEPAS